MKRIAAIALMGLALAATLAGVVWWATRPTSGPAPEPTPVAGSAVAVKLYAIEDGLYRVPLTDLESAGLTGVVQRSQDLALSWHDQPIPHIVEGNAVMFYAQGNRSPYAAESAIWATLSGDGVAPEERDVAPGDAFLAPTDTYTAALRLEEDAVYYARAPMGAERWYWVSLAAPRAFTISFELEGLVGGPGRLRAALLGSTQAPVQPDHHVRITVNDQPVADASWDGQTGLVVEESLPAGTLRDGENTLVVHVPGDTGAPAEIALLDWMEVITPRRLVAVDDRLAFAAPAGTYRLTGLAGSALAWDVTVPTAPVQLTGLVADPALTWTDTAAGVHQYAFAGPAGFLHPTRIVPAATVDLRDPATRADWVLIAPSSLVSALQPLVEWRREQGLIPLVVDVQAVYDAFSHGEASPQAIKDLLATAYASWARPAPRFVVLAGTASYDYRDVLNAPRKNLVPTYLLQSPYVGETGSDNWFVDVEADDGRPEFAIGRLSVGTADQARALAERIVAYERSARDASPDPEWRRRILFATDGKEANFRDMAERLIAGQVPTDTEVVRVHQGDFATPEEARSRLLEEWNQGALILTYAGHAGINVWTDRQFFRMADVETLRNGVRLPFVATMTCLAGYYHHPQVQCLGEALLLAPQGGAVAALVPTSESVPGDQEYLIRGLLEALYDPSHSTVGEAVMQAKRGLPDTHGARDLMATFNLLGDPATRLAW